MEREPVHNVKTLSPECITGKGKKKGEVGATLGSNPNLEKQNPKTASSDGPTAHV